MGNARTSPSKDGNLINIIKGGVKDDAEDLSDGGTLGGMGISGKKTGHTNTNNAHGMSTTAVGSLADDYGEHSGGYAIALYHPLTRNVTVLDLILRVPGMRQGGVEGEVMFALVNRIYEDVGRGLYDGVVAEVTSAKLKAQQQQQLYPTPTSAAIAANTVNTSIPTPISMLSSSSLLATSSTSISSSSSIPTSSSTAVTTASSLYPPAFKRKKTSHGGLGVVQMVMERAFPKWRTQILKVGFVEHEIPNSTMNNNNYINRGGDVVEEGDRCKVGLRLNDLVVEAGSGGKDVKSDDGENMKLQNTANDNDTKMGEGTMALEGNRNGEREEVADVWSGGKMVTGGHRDGDVEMLTDGVNSLAEKEGKDSAGVGTREGLSKKREAREGGTMVDLEGGEGHHGVGPDHALPDRRFSISSTSSSASQMLVSSHLQPQPQQTQSQHQASGIMAARSTTFATISTISTVNPLVKQPPQPPTTISSTSSSPSLLLPPPKLVDRDLVYLLNTRLDALVLQMKVKELVSLSLKKQNRRRAK
jgi:hypothetical protein